MALPSVAAPGPLERTEARFRAMGTSVHVMVLGGDGDLASRARDAIEDLEARWSRFRADSELCRLNASPGRPVVVSPETFALVERAVHAWKVTDGRYDPTILSALVAAGYDRDFASVPPESPAAVSSPVAAPGCAGIDLDPLVRAVTLPPDLAIDLGGLGKGRAADLVAQDLLAAGAAGVCVNLGGDLRVEGHAPHAAGWVVEVEDPFGSGEAGVLALARGAVATSTRLRRCWTRGGASIHHLIDPATGHPARAGLTSVTVIAAEAAWAEVLAKAAFVAGADGARELLDRAGVTGLLLHDDGRFEALAGLERFRP